MKKLLVVETPKMHKCLKEVLGNDNKQMIKDDYVFDCYGYVRQMEEYDYVFERQPDGEYIGYSPYFPDATLEGFRKLCLDSIYIPDDDKNKTFLVRSMPYTYQNDYLLKEVDEIVFVVDDFCQHVLASAKYIEDHGLDFSKVKYVSIVDYSDDVVLKRLSQEQSFWKVFDEVNTSIFKQ